MIIGVGTDIESVSRFRKLWTSKRSILEKLFFYSELQYALKKNKPWETLAGIWCAKESIIKSISSLYTLEIKDIEIKKPANEKFEVEIKSESLKEINFWISVSHTNDYATAFCIAESKRLTIK